MYIFFVFVRSEAETNTGKETVDEQITKVSKIIKDCVDRLALENQVAAFETQGNWVNNQITDEMVKRNELFQRWISQPTEENKNR